MNLTAGLRATAVVGLLCAGSAQATVLDFDVANLAPYEHSQFTGFLSKHTNTWHMSSYTEDGYTLDSSIAFGPATLYSPDSANVLYAGSQAMAASIGATTTLTRNGGGLFSIGSISLTSLLRGLPLGGTVAFTGTRADASTVVQSFSFNNSWTSFAFDSGFTNLASVSWRESLLLPGDYQVDNINVSASASAVPEPATYAMLAGGLGLLALALRRRRTAASPAEMLPA